MNVVQLFFVFLGTMSSGPVYSRENSLVRDSYKVCLAGKYSSGKTTLFNQVCGKSGIVEYKFRIESNDGSHTNVNIFDTGGRERYQSITMTDYYRNCDCVIFVYDITSLETLHYVKKELKMIQEKELCSTDAKFVLLRNKIDVDNESISVTEADESRYLRDQNMIACFCMTAEVSALKNIGISEFFSRDLFNVLTSLE